MKADRSSAREIKKLNCFLKTVETGLASEANALEYILYQREEAQPTRMFSVPPIFYTNSKSKPKTSLIFGILGDRKAYSAEIFPRAACGLQG